MDILFFVLIIKIFSVFDLNELNTTSVIIFKSKCTVLQLEG